MEGETARVRQRAREREGEEGSRILPRRDGRRRSRRANWAKTRLQERRAPRAARSVPGHGPEGLGTISFPGEEKRFAVAADPDGRAPLLGQRGRQEPGLRCAPRDHGAPLAKRLAVVAPAQQAGHDANGVVGVFSEFARGVAQTEGF